MNWKSLNLILSLTIWESHSMDVNTVVSVAHMVPQISTASPRTSCTTDVTSYQKQKLAGSCSLGWGDSEQRRQLHGVTWFKKSPQVRSCRRGSVVSGAEGRGFKPWFLSRLKKTAACRVLLARGKEIKEYHCHDGWKRQGMRVWGFCLKSAERGLHWCVLFLGAR